MAKIIDGIEYSDDMKSVVGAESRGITSAVIAEALGKSVSGRFGIVLRLCLW